MATTLRDFATAMRKAKVSEAQINEALLNCLEPLLTNTASSDMPATCRQRINPSTQPSSYLSTRCLTEAERAEVVKKARSMRETEPPTPWREIDSKLGFDPKNRGTSTWGLVSRANAERSLLKHRRYCQAQWDVIFCMASLDIQGKLTSALRRQGRKLVKEKADRSLSKLSPATVMCQVRRAKVCILANKKSPPEPQPRSLQTAYDEWVRIGRSAVEQLYPEFAN